MTTTEKPPVLVILQLTGGNDYFNTVIPYTDSRYRDYRPRMGIPEDKILPLDDQYGLHPSMEPLREMYKEGNVAIIHGTGYPNSERSHFCAMEAWHTCQPNKAVTSGWLGRVIREVDPKKENVLTAVNFGYVLPRALTGPGVSVASVIDLDTYGFFPGMSDVEQRAGVLDRFGQIYSPATGRADTMDYLAQTGADALKGADILRTAPQTYSSTVEYADNSIAIKLRSIAQAHLADLGTRVFYCDHLGFDTHTNQLPDHARLWEEVSGAISDFFDDLKEHDASDDVIMLLFSEFGRRARDNGTGTDHGAGGGMFVIGAPVRGGMYSEYPSTKPEDLSQGDLAPTIDFRGVYGTIVEKWLGLEAKPIVSGNWEQAGFL